MSEREVQYGLDAVEVIVRIKGEDVTIFNQLNDFSIDQIKEQIAGKELECIFQKISDQEHRILVPLINGYLALIVKEHQLTGTYEAVVHQKLKSTYLKTIILPDSDRFIESCSIRLIDINEGGRGNLASDELHELQKKVNRLPIASVVNIGNQQDIWFKWIEAQNAIIAGLQKPYDVKSTFSIQDVKNNDGDIIRYSIRFDHAVEILPEYNLLEQKLKTLGIEAKIDSEGSLQLTRENINILDAVLLREFNETIERDPTIGAIIGLRAMSLASRIQLSLPENFIVEKDPNPVKKKLTINCRTNENINEVFRKFGFELYDYRAKFTILNHGEITTNEIINKKYFLSFGRAHKGAAEKEVVFPNPEGNTFSIKYKDFDEIFYFYRALERVYGKENISDELYTTFLPAPGKVVKYFDNDFTEEYWTDLKRSLYVYHLEESINTYSKTIYLEFKNEDELQDQFKVLQDLKKMDFFYSPLMEDFKFKVKINISAKKTQRDLFLERLKMLRGAEFVVEIAEEGKRQPRIQYLGSLNGHESDLKKMVLNLPNIFPDQKKKAKEVLNFFNSEPKPQIKSIKANLTGDATKMSWLKNAVKKITQPTDAPNGKPVNNKLGEFAFDTSKADPIFNESKLESNSEEYQKIKANELLKLNESQRKAVISAINCTDLALLQGPPGTGKTTVIAEMIWQIISRDPKHRILLTSETNLAVDNALDRLMNTKGVNPKLTPFTTLIKPLRFGRMSKMDEEGAKYSVERILKWSDESYKNKQEYVSALDEHDEDIDDENVEKNNPENNAVQDWMKRIAERAKNNDPKYSLALKDWAFDLAMPNAQVRKLFTDKYFEYSNIVGSTCSSAGSPNFMWDYAKNMLKKETEAISKLNFRAQKAPFGREFSNALSDFDIPPSIINNFKQLERRYRQEEDVIKNYFSDREDIDNVEMNIHSLQTIDGKQIKSLNEKEKLISYKELIDFSKTNISPYFEECVHFDTVIMDEASKATPPELLLPLCFGKRSIVIGDHRQLPPMLNEKDFKEALKESGAEDLSNEIDREFTETSQFERMILNPKVSPTIISRCNIQYRMHPDINDVIKQFYIDEGGLEPAKELLENANSKELANPFSRHHGLYLEQFIDPNTHTIWVNVTTPETREGTSVTNEGEVQAIRIIIDLIKKAQGFNELQNNWNSIKDEFKRQQEQQIGVISFYGAQKTRIKRSLVGVGVPLKINTVDRFQGMERNIIIVSTVRSNKQTKFGGKIEPNKDSGFAKSPQRLNVALSRARRLLIVVGNKEFFEQVTDSKGRPLYKNAIKQIEDKGRIIDFETLKKLSK
jgi:hypothetical protein